MFSTSELARIIGAGQLAGDGSPGDIRYIATDSRQIIAGSESVFVALKGKRTDGHQYLRRAWAQGVRNFIVEDETQADLPESNVMQVDDCVRALQQLAAAHRARFTLPCIGITGSNGKTWVKEWLFQLLAPDEIIVRSPRSYNSQIGVPLSVLRIRPHHTLAIIEAGISTTGEMAALEEVIQPTLGVLTHFGDAHDAGFPDASSKLKEKCALFRRANAVVVAGDDPWLIGEVRTHTAGVPLYNWGHGQDATLQVTLSLRDGRCEVHCTYQDQTFDINLPFQDSASVRNALTCCLILLHLGYTPDVINRRVQHLQPLQMRLKIHQLPGHCLLIDDSYSFDLASLHVGLETLAQHSTGLDRVVVISDIDQQRETVYPEIVRLLNQYDLQAVCTIGSTMGTMEGFTAEHKHFSDVDAFLESKFWLARVNTAYLLKGARRFGLERIVRHMRARQHSAVLEVDLNAMLTNLQYFRSQLRPETRIIAMVKAAAYGSGAVEIGRFLAFHNVDALGVAYLDEGVELRKAGVSIPIIVMNPDAGDLPLLRQYELEPEVFDLEMLDLILRHARKHGDRMRVHIKLDTGMHRLGIQASQIDTLCTLLTGAGSVVEIGSVFTHLAAASDPEEQSFTLVQLNRFEGFYRAISAALGYRPERHVLNSGGIIYYPEYQYEAVRLGIGMYGVGLPFAPGVLEPVHTLTARISQVRTVEAGESVGYDRAFVAQATMRIATVNIGYADGFNRQAGNGRYAVLVGEARAPVVGNVCMDMTMIDISGLDSVRAGDEVVIFGPPGTLETLAEVCHTIPYEILTGISARIPRIFRFA
ncbi:MAG: bifunctional UDP-N-acetylmuramoyl-tripeptide:D-alanyl-D-alanine ligase/alanine racemase [Saprospiraceae bacterium]|nr:bifunctional UDP-N-acetylmuramoyl-tripeptide:D-alanyl-D-alanine ligase/alanine racemase [Saprospiraceae bacterium]